MTGFLSLRLWQGRLQEATSRGVWTQVGVRRKPWPPTHPGGPSGELPLEERQPAHLYSELRGRQGGNRRWRLPGGWYECKLYETNWGRYARLVINPSIKPGIGLRGRARRAPRRLIHFGTIAAVATCQSLCSSIWPTGHINVVKLGLFIRQFIFIRQFRIILFRLNLYFALLSTCCSCSCDRKRQR